MRASGSIEQFKTIRNSVSDVKNDRDYTDFNVILRKKDVVRDALAISDIVQCNKVPVLKHIANINQLQKMPSNKSFSLTSLNSFSNLNQNDHDKEQRNFERSQNIIKAGGSLNLSHRDAVAPNLKQLPSKSTKVSNKVTNDKNSSKNIIPKKSSKEKNNSEEDNKLALALLYMNNSKEILDSSRLMYEAALLFDQMQSYERAATCFVKSTKRVSAEIIVDTYDLPSDAAYKRKIDRMSSTMIGEFLRNRNQLRDKLIADENNRQRLRARASYCQLARIYLLTHLYDLDAAQGHITEAFKTCAAAAEHEELLYYFHELIKQYAAENKQEMEYEKQLIRGVAGPIAESHINILHDLEVINDRNTDVVEWLAFRYAEKCEFDISKSYFKKLRDLTTVPLDMKDTLELWRKPVCKPGEVNEEMELIRNSIRENVCKSTVGGHKSYDAELEEQLLAQQRAAGKKDHAWFGGKHESSNTILYSIPKQGWNTVNI